MSCYGQVLPHKKHGKTWLGRKDSNLRIPAPKAGALPLGHAPTPRGPGPRAACSAAWGGNTYRSRGYSVAATLRAYSRRLRVLVCSDSHPGRDRSLAVRRAASARSNRPKTADPDPDIAANVAPASSND